MSAFRICTIAAVVAGVSATLVPTSHAPVQKQQVTPFGGGPAVTTAAAAYSGLLHRRADDTCGYIDGTEAAWCKNPYECFYNDTASAAGCCTASTSCYIPTACLPSTSPAPNDTGVTKHCSYSASPSCLSLIYSNGPCLGCTWFICDSAGGRMAILTTRTKGMSTTPPPTTPPPSPTSPSPIPTPPPSPPTPTGAIVGGVVGGIAACALLGNLFYFLKRRRKPEGSGSEQEFAPEAQGGSNDTSQDFESSRAKSVTANLSTGPNSPSPPSQYQQSFARASWSASPVPAPVYPSSYLNTQILPQQHFQGLQNWYPAAPQEMAITQPERPVQEMSEMSGSPRT
ncbi:hypothetical protein VB005_08058 [Metarhizium brunneum]